MSFSEYMTEMSLTRVWQTVTTPGKAIGILTAFRGTYDRETNIRRNRQLAAEVRRTGYGYTYVDGTYVEEKGTPQERQVKETSLFIMGDQNLKRHLLRWMPEWEQEAVLFKPADQEVAYLLTKDGGEVRLGDFHPNRAAEYMTRLRNRPGSFTFEAAYEPMSWLGRWAKDRADNP